MFIALVISAGCSLLAQDTASTDYRDIATLYRTAPDEAVARVLLLPPAAHEKEVADAVNAATRWTWDDLAAAAMLETDAALMHLARKRHRIGVRRLRPGRRARG
ncbi:MAG: hypothetical protein DMF84_07435 [Acidobacteria bacterium]|nr:MAG: hypothetical protein DMF84_07435 [Acidobacteriota bacterium]